MRKSASIDKRQRIGIHSVIAFIALAAFAAAVVIFFPRFSLSGRGANGEASLFTPVPAQQTPDAPLSPGPTGSEPSVTPEASDSPMPTPDAYARTHLVIDGTVFASLASRQAAEELINTAVSHFELLCPGTGLVSKIKNRIEYRNAADTDSIISFDEALSSIIAEDSPLRVRTVFTRSDFETLPCEYDVEQSDAYYVGKKMQLHEYTYLNGVLNSLTLLEESILTEPVNDRVLIGTRPIPAADTARDFGFGDCPPTGLSFASPVDAEVTGFYGFSGGEFNRGIVFI